MERVIEVRDLYVRFYTYEGVVKAVDGIDFDVIRGETLGIVGETGSGKSVTTYAMMNMVPTPGRITRGRVLYRSLGKEYILTEMSENELRKLRGSELARIFQEPKAALNPVYTAGDQVSEAILIHRLDEMKRRALASLRPDGFLSKLSSDLIKRSMISEMDLLVRLVKKVPLLRRLYWNPIKAEVKKEVVRLFSLMGIPDPERVYGMYPHELSGGMQQRIVIAMALSCNPRVLIADEPTTNLDVTVEAQILELMKELKEKFDATLVYITHDMGVIAEMAQRVAVMYAGNIVEIGDVYSIFKDPLHPYTKGLLESIPLPGRPLKDIPGTVPNLVDPPLGCRFHPRCSHAMGRCSTEKPKLIEVRPGRFVACFLYHSEGVKE
ncbi:MAG: ABC transporter ATP-binding protein [Candidatus Korarchaeum sp.]|nr:ABC transporter ATP-binding protein [Candidatus Korarchaeum sp.]MDW8034986.1 ABC transporter ATP-binding protein [Candidatus Korarchaeum sp.]